MDWFEAYGGREEWLTPDIKRDQLGRVVAEYRSHYAVQSACDERPAHLAGRLRHAAELDGVLPAVGDWVVLKDSADAEYALIEAVLSRRSKFARKVAGATTHEQVVAANIDWIWIVSSLDRDLNLRRLERYLTLAWESGASPVIVLTKSDLCADAQAAMLSVSTVAMGVPIVVTSAVTREGLDDLSPYLTPGLTVALLGSSGVGKSTLINALAGEEILRTGAIRESDGKGRHTTTHRHLIRLASGALVVDTPGMRELQLWEAEEGVQDTFADVENLAGQCRYADCRHDSEPGCAVLAAVEAGTLPNGRLESYRKLQREAAYVARQHDARARAEEQRRWKIVHKSLRDHPKYRR